MSCNVCRSAQPASAEAISELFDVRDDFLQFRRDTKNTLEEFRTFANDAKASIRHLLENGGSVDFKKRLQELEEELKSAKAEIHSQRRDLVEVVSEVGDLKHNLTGSPRQRRTGVGDRERETRHEREEYLGKHDVWREIEDVRAEVSGLKKTTNRLISLRGIAQQENEAAAIRGTYAGSGRARDFTLRCIEEEDLEQRRRFDLEGEAALEWEHIPEHDQEQLLLIMVSYLHSLLITSPVKVAMDVLQVRGVSNSLERARSGLLSRFCGSLVATFLVSFLPLLFGRYVAPPDCEALCEFYDRRCQPALELDFCTLESIAQGPLCMLFGPCVALVLMLLSIGVTGGFVALETVALCCCCRCLTPVFLETRVTGRALLFKLFFRILHLRLPAAEFRGPIEFFVTCVSYVAVVAGLIVLAILRGRIAIGVTVAYAMGEVYCMILNRLLTPTDSAKTILEAEILRCLPESFWTRLWQNTRECFTMNRAEANDFRVLVLPWWASLDLGSVPTTPRYVKKLYLPDAKIVLEWDGLEHALPGNRSESRRADDAWQCNYRGIPHSPVGNKGPSESLRSKGVSETLGIYGNIAGTESVRTISPRPQIGHGPTETYRDREILENKSEWSGGREHDRHRDRSAFDRDYDDRDRDRERDRSLHNRGDRDRAHERNRAREADNQLSLLDGAESPRRHMGFDNTGWDRGYRRTAGQTGSSGSRR